MEDSKEEIERRMDELAREYADYRAEIRDARRSSTNYLRCVGVLITC
jgi:hypothetical protein